MMTRISSREFPLVTVRIGHRMVFCEHPTSNKDRENGLKGRPFLFDHKGMIFDTYGRYQPIFTMRDVIFDLEAIFVGTNYLVQDVVPMRKMDGSRAYTTPKRVPIKWVIEVNSGWSQKNGVKIGDKVTL